MPFHSLMFGWEYPPLHMGGLGVACQGMVRGLLKHGTRVTLVLPSHATDEHENLSMRSAGGATKEGAIIRYVTSNLQPYEGVDEYAQRMSTHGDGAMTDLYGPDLGSAVEQFAEQSVSATKDVCPDVVHCHDWMTYDAGVRAAAHHRVPLVAHIHATELDRTDFHPNAWIEGRERWGMMKADKVIAVSNYTKNLLVNHYGIPEGKIAVVHNGHDLPTGQAGLPTACLPTRQGQAGLPHDAPLHMPGRKSKVPLVLFLGRLTTQKNPWQFLEAAGIVHRERPETTFVMAGEGPMMSELIDRACTLGLTDSIVFTGRVSKHEAEKLYANAACFVMPSISEPFGLVALEAIAHGTPLVMSRQSGAAEVIEHCFKVDFWDTERFADCILTVLREQPLAAQLRAEAPRILQKLTWANQSAQILSVYKNLLQS